MKLIRRQQGLLGRTVSRSAATRPARRVAAKAADGSIPALVISGAIPPPWDVETSSSKSKGREYDNLQLAKWAMTEAVRAEIMDYLQQKLSDVVLPARFAYLLTRPDLEIIIEDISNEADTKEVFFAAFCTPAELILRTYFSRVNRKFAVKRNSDGAKVAGVPDFVFRISRMRCERGKARRTWEDLAVGEGKTPAVMRNLPRVVAQELEEDVKRSCMQICDYMRLRGLRYGFLTYLDGTFFIKRLGNDVYAFTDALPPNSRKPTITEMLLYVALKQRDEGPWQDIPTAYQADALANQEVILLRVPDRPTSIDSSSTSSSTTVSSYPEGALEFLDEILGNGQTGNVVHARLHGVLAAIKALDLSKQDDFVELLRNEVEMYEHLRDLQGVCIPRLLGHGLWHNDTTLFIATSVIHGDHPSYEGNPPEVLMAIQQALSSIHKHGVLHGDLRAENILLAKDGSGGVQAFFIDFGNSIKCDDPSKHAEEFARVRRLLGGQSLAPKRDPQQVSH